MVRRFFVAMTAALLLTTIVVPPAAAQVTDERTYFSFSQPVAIPGKVLPPGDYLFRLADADSGRKIVQVLTADLSEDHGIFFTTYTLRPSAPAEPEVSLGEAPEGMARSISTWWQPGNTYGRSFLYAPGEASWERSPATGRSAD